MQMIFRKPKNAEEMEPMVEPTKQAEDGLMAKGRPNQCLNN